MGLLGIRCGFIFLYVNSSNDINNNIKLENDSYKIKKRFYFAVPEINDIFKI